MVRCGRTVRLQSSSRQDVIVADQDMKDIGGVMAAFNYSDASEAEVQEMHVPICSGNISRQGQLYTCSEEKAKNYIGQDVIDTIKSKCDTKLSEKLLQRHLSTLYGNLLC